ncbi:MAG: hypothetical protein JO180_06650 [Gemmatirosa sp.]|nr:hypothetical protein [Gemmatirosa sp.]
MVRAPRTRMSPYRFTPSIPRARPASSRPGARDVVRHLRRRALDASYVASAACAALALVPRGARAQLAIIRTSAAAPLDVDSGRVFPAPMFVGDVGHGNGSADDSHAWDATLVGVIQLRTRNGKNAIVGQVANELTANPYTSGGLNPRGTAWEETVSLMRRTSLVDVSIGYAFRCRHEVDGATAVDERPSTPATAPTTRIVMTKGLKIELASHDVVVAPRTHVRAFVSADRFTAHEDWRLPQSLAGPDWAHSTGRVTGALRVSRTVGRWAAPYGRVWASTTFFDANGDGAAVTHGTGTRLEAGVRLGAGGGTLDVFAASERLFDDLSHATPTRSRATIVGVRLGSGAFF